MKESKTVEMISAPGIKYGAFIAGGTDTKQMTAADRIYRIDSALGAGTVFLPPIADVPLLDLYLVQATATYSGAIAVKPFQGGQSTPDSIFREGEDTLAGGTATSESITAAYGWILVLSNGISWIVVGNDLDAA
jgi:hypothetical protein